MRRRDWPERLADAIESAQTKEFTQTYFCATFAADCVLAMTDTDPMEGYRGLSQDEAEAELEYAGYENIRDFLEERFEPVHIAMARRGDVVLRENAEGQALGICLGQQCAFASRSGGLAFHPTLEQLSAYRVK